MRFFSLVMKNQFFFIAMLASLTGGSAIAMQPSGENSEENVAVREMAGPFPREGDRRYPVSGAELIRYDRDASMASMFLALSNSRPLRGRYIEYSRNDSELFLTTYRTIR